MSCVAVSGALAGVAGFGRGFSRGETGAPDGYVMAASFEGFARRLHLALDSAGFERGRARTGALAKDFNVSRETARKWLNGLALPELDRMIGLATRARVAFEWLATGRGPMTIEPAPMSVRDGDAVYFSHPDTQRLVGIIEGLSEHRRRALMEFLSENGGTPR